MEDPIKYDYEKPVIEVPNSKTPGQTAIYRNALSPDSLVGSEPSELNTLYGIVSEAFREAADKPLYGTRVKDKATGKPGEYAWLTYKEVQNQVDEVGSGLINLAKDILNLPTERNWKLGIFSCNRLEWSVSDLAVVTHNLTTVALFDTYGQETLEYVINHSEIAVIVASSNYIHRILQGAERLTSLKMIISMDPMPHDAALGSTPHLLRTWAASTNIKFMDFDDLRDLGRKKPVPHCPPSPEDIYTLCYTSGTTGNPKGAVCTHLNYASSIRACYVSAEQTREDLYVAISYLPASHCFERVTSYLALHYRGQIGFYSGDVKLLSEDMAVLKPTVMSSVPRLLNRIYDQIALKTIHGTGVGASLFKMALESKLAIYRAGGGFKHPVWDKVVFSKVRDIIGGRVMAITSGSAPLDPKVLDFLRVVLSCNIYEGYGATETCAGLSITIPGEYKAGSVGVPVICNEVKLIDVPEMGYLSEDKPHPRGEICVRGNNIFKGYYKSPEKTQEALDSEGWYHTGDIGKLDDRKQVTIIDRKKNLFKLSQGEYIAPEKVENVYTSHQLIMQMFVFGDSLHAHLVAIVVPDPESFLPWARKLASSPHNTKDSETELAHYCKDAKVNSVLLKDLNKKAVEGKLNGFERVHVIHLEPTPFSADNGFITPTFKLKRHELTQHYKSIITAMYEAPPTTRL